MRVFYWTLGLAAIVFATVVAFILKSSGADTASERILDSLADLFTVIASGMALYLFFFRRKEVATVVRALSNFAFQTTLAELQLKLDDLANRNANEQTQVSGIVEVWHSICGQIEGNPMLSRDPECKRIVEYVRRATNRRTKTFSQPENRAYTAQLRERLKHIDAASLADNFEDITQ